MRRLAVFCLLPLAFGCTPPKPTGDRVAHILRSCTDTRGEFGQLVELSLAGAVSTSRANDAMRIAQRCGSAASELRKMKAPDSCVAITDTYEVMAWKTRTAISRGTVLTIEDFGINGSGLSDSVTRCVSDAHFPEWKFTRDTPPTPAEIEESAKDKLDSAKADKELEASRKAAEDASIAAAKAMAAAARAR